MRRAAVIPAAVLLVGFVVAGCPRPIEELALNEPPVARLLLPQLWPAGEPAAFDPLLSEDPEGAPLSFHMTYGDGTAEAQGVGVLEHVFAVPAAYAVELTATDDQGQDARVQAQVVVVGDELEECTCELPCLDGATCVAGVCTRFASSVPEEGTPALDGALTCP